MPYNNFYDLDVWKYSRQLKLSIYTVVKTFPDKERFELSNQLRRAARSVSANLAEGHGRQTLKDEIHFCIIARGSLSEVLNHLIDARDCGYITDQSLVTLKQEWDTCVRIINGYIKHLRSRLPGNSGASQIHEPEIGYNDQNKSCIETAEDFIRKLDEQS